MKLELMHVQSLMNLMARGEWDLFSNLTSGRGLDARTIRSVVEGYGRQLVDPPLSHYESVDVMETVDGTLDVRAPLYTLEEGRSDLQLVLTLTPVMEGIWSIRVDDILVA